MVIYCHSMVLLSFCAIMLYYHGNYCVMAIYYHGKGFISLPMVANLNMSVIYCGILTLENVGAAVNYCGIFITLAPVGFNSPWLCFLPLSSRGRIFSCVRPFTEGLHTTKNMASCQKGLTFEEFFLLFLFPGAQ